MVLALNFIKRIAYSLTKIFIGRNKMVNNKVVKIFAITGMYVATAFLILATYFFTKEYWGPGILSAFN